MLCCAICRFMCVCCLLDGRLSHIEMWILASYHNQVKCEHISHILSYILTATSQCQNEHEKKKKKTTFTMNNAHKNIVRNSLILPLFRLMKWKKEKKTCWIVRSSLCFRTRNLENLFFLGQHRLRQILSHITTKHWSSLSCRNVRDVRVDGFRFAYLRFDLWQRIVRPGGRTSYVAAFQFQWFRHSSAQPIFIIKKKGA